jgi:hypothetical protein
MKIKFKTFHPGKKYINSFGPYTITATEALNDWLAENPNVEIISWQTTPVGTAGELYITIQYREQED